MLGRAFVCVCVSETHHRLESRQVCSSAAVHHPSAPPPRPERPRSQHPAVPPGKVGGPRSRCAGRADGQGPRNVTRGRSGRSGSGQVKHAQVSAQMRHASMQRGSCRQAVSQKRCLIVCAWFCRFCSSAARFLFFSFSRMCEPRLLSSPPHPLLCGTTCWQAHAGQMQAHAGATFS